MAPGAMITQVTAIPLSPTVVEPSASINRKWRTDLHSCNSDEETTWWGTWCCFLLHARTNNSFEVDTSNNKMFLYYIYFLGLLLLPLISSFLLVIFAASGGMLLAWQRAKFRSAIREKLQLSGSFSGDLVTHLCCSCCAVCQEAREEKIMMPRAIDFCTGEDLSSQDWAHQRSIGHGEGLTDSANPEGGNIFTNIKLISKLSRIILRSACIFTAITTAILLYLRRPLDVVILCFVFLQPLVILYFIYWRARRQYASLDFVIKCFAVGYWLTTFQSIVLESILQITLGLFLGPFMKIPYGANLNNLNTNNDHKNTFGEFKNVPNHDNEYNIKLNNNLRSAEFPLKTSTNYFQQIIYKAFQNVILVHNTFFNSNIHGHNNFYSSPTPTISWGSKHQIFDSKILKSYFLTNSASDPRSIENISMPSEDLYRKIAKDNIVIVFVGCFLMAFVVAAGVEETMKHFVVRCCRFPTPLKNPQTVLVYLMSGALGFATKENIQYVFGAMTPDSTAIPNTSIFLGELLVLFLRILMPVHLICSVMQATNLSKVIIGNSEMSLFMVLMPGILLHGTFDFSLFFMGALGFIYDIDNIIFTVATFAVVGGLTIGGSIYAYRSYKKVEADFQNGYGIFSTEDDDVVVVNL